MLEQFDLIRQEAKQAIERAGSLQELEQLKSRFLGRKSVLTSLSNSFAGLSPQEKPQAGRAFNQTKSFIASLIEEKKKSFGASDERLDVTFASQKATSGSKHPVSMVVREICDIFSGLGFEIQEGKEVEDEWHNFQALNIPLEHPSRDMFDTFYVDLKSQGKYKHLLRSHTSPSQIRLMKKRRPPVAFIVPGRVYRPDAVDASHSFMFHQIEGFAVDKDINFSQLKGSLVYFARHMFSDETRLRFRPSFFPFTEPSAEVDISCIICKGKGCSVCKRTGWVEVLGCGMIHPNVLKACNIDSKKYRGFAFGMGIERIAMLKFGINDIRLFFENDVRFLEQFYEV